MGYALMWLRPDAVTCGVEPVAGEFPRGITDPDWIRRVAAHGWVAITKNRKIRTNPVEAQIAIDSALRTVGFAGRSGNLTSWQMVTLLTRHWAAIEAQAAVPGPWWLSVSATSTRVLDYRAS